jgi:HEAT repeat protein
MKVDDLLRRLAELRKEPASPAMIEEVRKAIRHASGFVVAKAADIVREKRLDALRPDLADAFERCLRGGEKTDKGCEAKLAIVRCLHELEWEEVEVFRKGVRCVQLEPTWGGSTDTGVSVRAASANALARTRYPKVLLELVGLLVDPEPRVRSAAADAIGAAGRPEGELLLRLKVMISASRDPARARMIEPEVDVVTASFASILSLGRSSSVEFVAGFLESQDDAVRDAAAIALGSSRLPEAFDALKRQWTAGMDQGFMETLLLALATLRDDRAIAFLVEQVEQGPPRIANAALEALKPLRTDERVRTRVEEAIGKRKDESLRRIWRG